VRKRDLESLADIPRKRQKPCLREVAAHLDAIDFCRTHLPDMYNALVRKRRSRRQLAQLRKLYYGRSGWALGS
jgi:hypothetical protein